jgi:hypothetical protein
MNLELAAVFCKFWDKPGKPGLNVALMLHACLLLLLFFQQLLTLLLVTTSLQGPDIGPGPCCFDLRWSNQ